MSSRRFFSSIVALVITSLLVLTACHKPVADDPNTLYVGLSSRPTTLDPRHASDANSERITDLIFSSLVRNGPDLKPIPQAALSWKIEEKKITLVIRNDLKFHSGRPVTMDDVVFSLDQYRAPSSAFSGELSSIEKVTTAGNQLVLHLKSNDAPLLSNLAYVKILPREELEKYGDSFTDHPVGSGPFRFNSASGNQVVLEKSASAPYAVPKVQQIVFKVIRDDNTRFLKMIKGDIDLLLNELPEEKVMAIERSGQVNVMVTPGLNFNYLLLNLKDERLKEREVRRALFAALDRDSIIKYKLEGLASAATSILAPSNPFSAKNLKLDLPSLDEAKRIIKRHGLSGAEFSLKTSDQGLANGIVIAQQLERLGVKIKLQSFEWGTFYADIKAGRFGMATMRWVGIVDPDIYRDTLASSEVPPGKNRGYYTNKAFDEVVNLARSEINFEKRRALYEKAQQMIVDDLPTLPLWYNANVSIVGKHVKNFVPMITGSFYPLTEVTKQ